LHVTIWAATTDLVLDLALRGVGAGVLPRYVAEPYLRRRRLRVVSTGRPELMDAVWLNELAGAYRDVTLEAFRAAVTGELGPAPEGRRRAAGGGDGRRAGGARRRDRGRGTERPNLGRATR
jgi:DNA-binding transcriptional LysR family regulator